MGTVTILPGTTEHPISLMGKMSGICYGSDIEDEVKNYKRGKRCVEDGHGRVLEFAQVYMRLDGYSARVIREMYTHIGSAPTRLQASTRYINYENFKYVTPKSIERNKDTKDMYDATMRTITKCLDFLNNCGVPKEDVAMILPLGMATTVSIRDNARSFSNMAAQRLCTRAYWEYRQLMQDIIDALSDYSPEWKELCNMVMKCKCDVSGYCLESKSCGKYPKKNEN